MSDQPHLARLTEIVVDQLGVNASDVTLEADFCSDFGADSLDQVELVMTVEEEFEIEIQDEEAEKLRTVKDALEMLNQKVA
jgi:acyl carrier protein